VANAGLAFRGAAGGRHLRPVIWFTAGTCVARAGYPV